MRSYRQRGCTYDGVAVSARRLSSFFGKRYNYNTAYKQASIDKMKATMATIARMALNALLVTYFSIQNCA